ncbi:unnamed protein product [Linum tenue]|uniref:Uncharacterized protein n=1 Tax=Linum tenue TaxID=586396 RepID=A0AAV0KIZ7_9ROSI|nr:unnamed protein product [Linum tenue]
MIDILITFILRTVQLSRKTNTEIVSQFGSFLCFGIQVEKH